MFLSYRDLQPQFERGNYTVKNKDVHVPANCLKLWLRELDEPLVPNEAYENAIAVT